METRGLESRRTKGRSDGWVAEPRGMGWGCASETRPLPCCPEEPPQSTSVLAFRLPLPPLQTVGRGKGRERAWASRIPSRRGQCPGRGCSLTIGEGSPTHTPGPAAGIGSSKGGPGSRPCPQPPLPPQTHPNPKAMRVRVYRNYVQNPENASASSPQRRRKLDKTHIFCIWSPFEY